MVNIKLLPKMVCLVIYFSTITGTISVAQESDYYKITAVPIPEEVVLEVGGLAFDDRGTLAATTRRGEVWLIKNPDSNSPIYTRFAHGLHEPLGLAYKDGSYYCSQRGELTKLTDSDGDGLADIYKAIYSWDLEGNYHEYSYGPVFTPSGDMLVTLNLGWIGRGASLSKWRGWLLKITESGEMTPIATGMRSPAGFGFNHTGDLFYTENQGDWVGSGRMTHVETGDFVGNPEGLKWSDQPGSPLSLRFEDIDDSFGYTLYEYSKKLPEIKPPSVWFPHTLMGISTSDIAVITDKFGPFEGQLLVGDQGHSKIMRVYQEKVNGVYQGACFPFVEGFSSGVLRLRWSPNGESLYVGMTSRGWASTGPQSYALERLNWTGEMPFEIKTIKATSGGFELEFTEPIDKITAQSTDSYSITDFTYKYHRNYGSPVVDNQKRSIQKIKISEDGLRVSLQLDLLRPGYIYEIKAPGINNINEEPLLHSLGYYTLNEIPGGGVVSASTPLEAVDNSERVTSVKNITRMPESWEGSFDEALVVGTLPGLKFDTEEIQIKAGAKVKLTFNNSDDMLHNLVITAPDQVDKVGVAAMNLGLEGQEKEYVPDMAEVLFHTSLLQPETSETIYFEAPSAPGRYSFVCTFPGHHTVMRGILVVN